MYAVGIYARLSVDGGSRKSESIEAQTQLAREYMKGRTDMMLYGCYSDLGRTGTNFQREGFERLMSDVKLGRVNCIIVKDFSRFGRNYIETGNYLQKIFPFMGVRFISVTDCFDSLYDMPDDIGINLKNLANEMYARDIGLKVKSAKRAKWEAGGYTGGFAPYGYEIVRSGGGEGLAVKKETAEVVREIFQLFDEGGSLRTIGDELRKREVHPPAECRRYGHPYRQEEETLKEWGRVSVKAVLTNPIYMGCMIRAAERGGDYMLRRPEDLLSGAWLVKESSHEAIIDREQFFRVAGRFRKL